MDEVLVNVARWDGPSDLPVHWPIANAPRPLSGQRIWTGVFRHGTFYAAAPDPLTSWADDDARLVRFVTNDDIRRAVDAVLAEHGYSSLDEAGVSIQQMAEDLRLPWADTPDGWLVDGTRARPVDDLPPL